MIFGKKKKKEKKNHHNLLSASYKHDQVFREEKMAPQLKLQLTRYTE